MAYSLAKKKKIVKAILAEYSKGNYSIISICKNQGITYRTFRLWEKGIKSDTAANQSLGAKYHDEPQEEQVKEAESNIQESSTNTITYNSAKDSRYEIRKGRLKELAITALEKYLSPWEVEERTQTAEKNADGTAKSTKLQISKKLHYPPPLLVKFTLEKTDPETFGNNKEASNENANHWIEIMKSIPIQPDTISTKS